MKFCGEAYDVMKLMKEADEGDLEAMRFSDYDEAYMYVDESFNYVELEPNMKKTGNFIYNVPEDSSGYYFACMKDGTNDGYRFYGD